MHNRRVDDPRHHSVNFLTSVVLTVLLLHAGPIGGWVLPIKINGTHIAQNAGYGFLGINAHLIAGRDARNPRGRFDFAFR